MLTSTDLPDRTAMLDNLVRRALLTGELGHHGVQTVHVLHQQQNLTAAETRILEIIQDALGNGDVRQVTD